MSSPRSPRSRAATAMIAFALAFVLAWTAAVAALTRAGIPYADVDLDVMGPMQRELARLAEPRAHDALALAYFGDSLSVSYPPGHRVPDRLAASASDLAGGRRLLPFTFATPGFTPLEFYFLAHEVARARPDVLVLAVNLSVFSDVWRHGFARPELAGWIPPDRLAEALTLPLDWIGLGPDRLALQVAVVRTGGFPAWLTLRREQARAELARTRLEALLQPGADSGPRPALGVSQAAVREAERWRAHPTRKRRSSAARARMQYGPVLAGLPGDHPLLQVIDATIGAFRERGIPVVVFVVPANVEHLASIGVLDDAGLAKSIAAIAGIAERRDAHFVDIHDAFPDSVFTDATGHFGSHRGSDGAARLAELLAPRVAMALAPR